jgi:hypothetical protein
MASRISKALFLSVVLLAGLGAVNSASAQSWAVTPYLGYFLPTGSVLGEDDFGEDVSQQSTLMFGGRLARMFNSSWGAEFSIGYAGSGLEGEDSGIEEDGNLMMFSLRALYMFPGTGKARLYGAAGLGYVTRGGDIWDDFDVDGKNDIAGNLAFGVMFPLSPMLNLRFELEDYLYSAKFEDGSFESESKFQNDLVLSAGVHIPFGGN